ncbi:helix-loop-helix DNA-binding domain-containing protein [Aspergillus heterothallicus]
MNLAGSACLKPLTVKEYQELADFSSYSTSGVMATSDSLISDTSSQWGRPVTLPQQRRDPASDSTALNATWNNDSPERHGHSWQHKQAGRRKSHNIVERKYRINLNSKFRQLRDRVLEATQPSPSPTGGIPPTRRDGVEAKKLRGASSPNTTLSKADTLDIAIKYIMSMEDEIFLLKERLRMVETSSGGSL